MGLCFLRSPNGLSGLAIIIVRALSLSLGLVSQSFESSFPILYYKVRLFSNFQLRIHGLLCTESQQVPKASNIT